MTKNQLSREAARASGYPITVCHEVALKLFGSPMGAEIGIIADLLFQGRTVQLRGFGTFYPKTRKERSGYDMQRKVPVTIPKRIVALFSPAPNMKKTDGL